MASSNSVSFYLYYIQSIILIGQLVQIVNCSHCAPLSNRMTSGQKHSAKGNISYLQHIGLQYHHQIMISFADIFDYEDDAQLKKITSNKKFIESVINMTYLKLKQLNCPTNYNEIINLVLPTVWPLLIRTDPTKFTQNLKYLQKVINLKEKHICFMIYYSEKYPTRFPKFCLQGTLQYFQVPSHQLEYQELINVIVGQQSIEALLTINKFNITKEAIFIEQSQFSHEDSKLSSMKKIVQNFLSHKLNIKRLLNTIKNEQGIVKFLDSWLKQKDSSHMINTFHVLKSIILCQCLLATKLTEQSQNKMQCPISKILDEVSLRLLNRLFGSYAKQKILILQWILQGKIWARNQELRNQLILYLVAAFQLHSNQHIQADDNMSKFVKKLRKQENLIIRAYITAVKNKYFSSMNLKAKVPKYYLRMNLGLFIDQVHMDSGNSLNKNNSGTISLQKLQSLTNPTNLQKLIGCIFKYTQNLDLQVVYIILLVLQNQVIKSSKSQPKQSEQNTDTEQKRQSQKILQPNSHKFLVLFKRVVNSIKQYEEMFSSDRLVGQINSIISTFVVKFKFANISELYRTDLHDLEIIANGQLTLENLASKMLRNTKLYELHTIYQIQTAQNIYNKSISQNKIRNTNKSKKAEDEKDRKIDSSKSERSTFVNSLGKMIHIISKKKQQIEFLQKVAVIKDKRIIQTLYLNLIYYILLKTTKSIQAEKQKLQRRKLLSHVLRDLFQFYFTSQSETEQIMEILYILATAYKILENWRNCTKRSYSLGSKNLQPFMYDNIQHQRMISYFYWETLIVSAKQKNKYLKYAKKFQKLNCIKQSIYLFHINQKAKQVAISQNSTEMLKWLFNLHSRLQTHMLACQPYIYHQFEKSGKSTNIFQADRYRERVMNRQMQEKLNWYDQLKFLTDHTSPQSFSSIIYSKSMKICQLQDIQQINQILNDLYICSCYYQAIKAQSFNKLHETLQKVNQKDISLSIARCLGSKMASCTSSKQKQTQKYQKMQQIIYNSKLRYNQFNQLHRQLSLIPPQKMNNEQLRTGIILYSKRGEFDNVRVLYNILNAAGKNSRYKQEMGFYNMEASYKSIMLYGTDKVIQNLDKIVRIIQDQTQAQNIDKNATKPVFEAFKFICENNQQLSLQQETKILKCMNRYLKKVYSIQNYTLSIEAAYFILRFILIQSKNIQDLLRNSSIFQFQNYKPFIIQPHKSLLISNIRQNANKNQFIRKILIKIAQNDPKASVWWIFGLKYHCTFPKIQAFSKAMDNINSVDKSIQNLGEQLEKQLNKKYLKLDEQFVWINWLITAEPSSDLMKIPQNMVSPFSKQVILQKVVKISPLGHGKSKPVIIQFKAIKNKKKMSIYIIRKFMTNFRGEFRTESATANFFKDCRLLDDTITYSIIHLNKYSLLVEYIQNKATLDNLMINKLNSDEETKFLKLMSLIKREKLSVMSYIYEKQELEINFCLKQFFFSPGNYIINSWWKKYTNFLKTYAQWCFLGYIVGLGDRHTNNILVTEEGKVIHIDFEYIFDSGKLLPYPEWVPFRITRGLMEQMTAIQPFGVMYSEFVKTGQAYKEKSRQIWQAYSHFSYTKKKNICNQIDKKAQLQKRPFQQSLFLFNKANSSFLLRDMFVGWGSYK